MILRDSHGFCLQHDIFGKDKPDGGDTARSTSLLALSGSTKDKMLLPYLYVGRGLLVRHPDEEQSPWNNPSNFSRDQLLPVATAMWQCKDDFVLKEIFKAHVKRFMTCQNGDILWWPTNIWFMIKACGIEKYYWFKPIGEFFLKLDLIWYTRIKPWSEHNQFMSVMWVIGGKEYYKKHHPNWKQNVLNYFCENDGYWRDQREIAEAIIKAF